METYFPKNFKGTGGLEYTNELLKKLRLEVDEIVFGYDDSREEKLDKHERNLLRLDVPSSWNPNKSGNMEIEMETEFEKFLFAVSEHTNRDTDEITVFKFYALTDFIKEKNKK